MYFWALRCIGSLFQVSAKRCEVHRASFCGIRTDLTQIVAVQRLIDMLAVQLIKGGYSHALGEILGRNHEIWQRGFRDHRIRDEQDFSRHKNYIHQNPVERGLVMNASEYRYCSAYSGFKLDPWPSEAKAEFSKSA